MRMTTAMKTVMIVVALAAIGVTLLIAGRRSPQDLPWTALDPGAPVGLFTGRKLAALRDDPRACRALLGRAGVRYLPLARHSDSPQCGYADGVRFEPGGARQVRYVPADLGMSCAVAAALAIWEWNVVQPAALRHYGQPVTRIDHYGSYSCRRMYGRASGGWSEHSMASAIDIAGFRLANGRRITVARDWGGSSPDAAFLRDVRDGACRVFATTLSPDYNRAHADHLHLDQARRGRSGFRACR
jgi:hypothetical protein